MTDHMGHIHKPILDQGVSARVKTRAEFGRFLNELGLVGKIVELGVHRGDFAVRLLDEWVGEKYYGVDLWEAGYDTDDPASEGDREDDYAVAMRNLSPYMDRVEILKTDTVYAADYFQDETIDFVYVDACHQQEAVAADIKAWWPKIIPGGVLAGHDYENSINAHRSSDQPRQPSWADHIQPVVHSFAQEIAHTLWIVQDHTSNWSWYFIKESLV